MAMSNHMSNAALNTSNSNYDDLNLVVFSILSPRQYIPSNEYPSITSCHYQCQMVLMQSLSSWTSSLNSKFSYLQRLWTSPHISFNITSNTFSPTSGSQR